MSCVDERLARFPPYQYNFRPPVGINHIIKLSYPFMPAALPISPFFSHLTLPQAPLCLPPQSLYVPVDLPASYEYYCNLHRNMQIYSIVSPAPRSSKTPVRACLLNCGFSLVNSIGLLKQNLWTYNFVEVSGHNLESSQTLRFLSTMFTLQTSFKPLLLK